MIQLVPYVLSAASDFRYIVLLNTLIKTKRYSFANFILINIENRYTFRPGLRGESIKFTSPIILWF